MTRFIAILTAAVLAVFSMQANAQEAESRYGEQKVVYHINSDGGADDAYYRAAMRNVQNQINAVGSANIDAKVVMHGDGVGLLMRATENDLLQSQIGNLKAEGVDFLICNNTLEGRDIALGDLYDAWEADVVPSGVAELSYLQAQGYTYIKP